MRKRTPWLSHFALELRSCLLFPLTPVVGLPWEYVPGPVRCLLVPGQSPGLSLPRWAGGIPFPLRGSPAGGKFGGFLPPFLCYVWSSPSCGVLGPFLSVVFSFWVLGPFSCFFSAFPRRSFNYDDASVEKSLLSYPQDNIFSTTNLKTRIKTKELLP